MNIKKIIQVAVISALSMIVWELGHPYIVGVDMKHDHSHSCK
jgi:riboflavin transporter FmnP